MGRTLHMGEKRTMILMVVVLMVMMMMVMTDRG